jgi:hypothetical protein
MENKNFLLLFRIYFTTKTLQAKHGYRPPDNFTDFSTSKKDLTEYLAF